MSMWPSAADAKIMEAFRESMTWYTRMETMHEKTKENGVLPRVGDTNASLILANLTDIEFDALQRHHVPYSGSTGKGGIKGYEPYGPYVATFWGEFERAMHVLGWTHIEFERVAPHQVVVNRAYSRRSRFQTSCHDDHEAMREAEATAEVLCLDTAQASRPGEKSKENADRPSCGHKGIISALERIIEQQAQSLRELLKAVQGNALTAVSMAKRLRYAGLTPAQKAAIAMEHSD